MSTTTQFIQSRIAGIGSYLPEQLITNKDLEKWWTLQMSGSPREQEFVRDTKLPTIRSLSDLALEGLNNSHRTSRYSTNRPGYDFVGNGNS